LFGREVAVVVLTVIQYHITYVLIQSEISETAYKHLAYKSLYLTLFIQKHIHHLHIAMKTVLLFQILQPLRDGLHNHPHLLLPKLYSQFLPQIELLAEVVRQPLVEYPDLGLIGVYYVQVHDVQ
jgi:hypothetical protein